MVRLCLSRVGVDVFDECCRGVSSGDDSWQEVRSTLLLVGPLEFCYMRVTNLVGGAIVRLGDDWLMGAAGRSRPGRAPVLVSVVSGRSRRAPVLGRGESGVSVGPVGVPGGVGRCCRVGAGRGLVSGRSPGILGRGVLVAAGSCCRCGGGIGSVLAADGGWVLVAGSEVVVGIV